ncbi:MAG TPA: 2Fe-2S iron-sulfur cluster-binding protein [Noviherbaspirillum sp.]
MSDPTAYFSIAVEPHGWEFEASSAMPLLNAAAHSHIRLPSSCRNGTCRTCMCRMMSGRGSYRIEWPGLTREEQAEGFILPCIAYPQSDLIIAVPGAALLKPPLDGQAD